MTKEMPTFQTPPPVVGVPGVDPNLGAKLGAAQLGSRLADEYHLAMSGASSPWGQFRGPNQAGYALMKLGYSLAFPLLVEEGEKEIDKLEDELDDNGNVIVEGKDSNPEFEQPETGLGSCPPLEDDPFRKFVVEYKSEYNLRQFTYFEFFIQKRKKVKKETVDAKGNITVKMIDGDIVENGLADGDDIEKVSDIFATRLLYQFKFLSTTKKLDFIQWLNNMIEVPEDTTTNNSYYENKKEQYHNVVINQIKQFVSSSLADPGNSSLLKFFALVHSKTIDAIGKVYGIANSDQELVDLVGGGIRNMVSGFEYPFDGGRDLLRGIAQDAHTPDMTVGGEFVESNKLPKILTPEIITFFTFKEENKDDRDKIGIGTSRINNPNPGYKPWYFTLDQVEDKYLGFNNDGEPNRGELHDFWLAAPEMNENMTIDDIIATNSITQPNKPKAKGGTQFMYTRQQAIDSKKEVEDLVKNVNTNSDNPYEGMTDAYDILALATMLYWLGMTPNALTPMPAALPCLINAPLGGLHIPIYPGTFPILKKSLKKALNAGKIWKGTLPTQPVDADAAATLVATALAATYALHLLELKFVYLGGIPTPVGPIPMIGMVPFVF